MTQDCRVLWSPFPQIHCNCVCLCVCFCMQVCVYRGVSIHLHSFLQLLQLYLLYFFVGFLIFIQIHLDPIFPVQLYTFLCLYSVCRAGQPRICWRQQHIFSQLQHLRDIMFSSSTTAAHTLLTPKIQDGSFFFTPPAFLTPTDIFHFVFVTQLSNPSTCK